MASIEEYRPHVERLRTGWNDQRRDAVNHALTAGIIARYGESDAYANAVGRLMGNLLGSVMIEGFMARLAYKSLRLMHERTLHGTVAVAATLIADRLARGTTRPRLKLH